MRARRQTERTPAARRLARMGPRDRAASLTLAAMALGLELLSPSPARASPPPATAPEITALRLSADLQAIALRLGLHRLELHLGHFYLEVPLLVAGSVGSGHADLDLAPGGRDERPGSAGLSLAARLHLGMHDRVSVTAGYDYLLPRQASPGRLLGPRGAFGITLGPGLALTGVGNLLGGSEAFGRVGLSYRVVVGGAVWYLWSALGSTFRQDGTDCRGGGRLRVRDGWCAFPAALLGIEGGF